MKKNISINISGIIFHIEEDAYQDLKAYLESIADYFSSYEDSQEITADIESRIAEIFLAKLDDQKQVIVDEDVKILIDTMGTVADFEAVEDEIIDEKPIDENTEAESKESTTDKGEPIQQPANRLYRDEKRKVIGGVAAGIGHYLNIDPLWVRLAFVILLLNMFIGALSGITLLTYFILWIVVPGSSELGDNEKIKKMFRNPESRVLGGVSSGIAAYFGIDVTIVRLLFVLSVFLGGSGVILYVILWIITPEAKTITEKMQMQGEPVTLSNIQQTVKKSLTNEKGVESPVAKILLFPFRMLAALFEAIGKILGPVSQVLVEVLRVFAGIVVTFVGLSTMVSLLVLFLFLLGLLPGIHELTLSGLIPIDVLPSTFSPLTYLTFFISAFVPFLFLALLGISILVKRIVIKATLGWTLFALWVLSSLSMAFVIPRAVASFAREGEYSDVKRLEVEADPVTLRVNYIDGMSYDEDMVRIRGHQDSTFKLVTLYTARGASRAEAQKNAQMISYKVESKGEEIFFDSDFVFGEDSKFRAQNVEATLYVPYGRTFRVDEDMVDLMDDSFSRSGYWSWQVKEDNLWKFTSDGLTCTTCPKREKVESSDNQPLEYMDDDPSSENSGVVSYDLIGFDEVEIDGFYKVYIEQSKNYDVKIVGAEKYRDQVIIKKFGDQLSISAREKDVKWFEDWSEDEKLKIYIATPKLEKITSRGFCQIKLEDIETEELSIYLSGASTGHIDVDVSDLYLKLNGGTSLDAEGRANYVKADISGASAIKALDMKTNTFDIQATGVSKAKINVKKKLLASVSGISHVRYEGDPEIKVDTEAGLSSVERL